jgi:diguanylate cyclase (GGDEF)-like protein/PAS domain S-box-containing protein
MKLSIRESMHLVLFNLLVASSYFVAGWLGNLFSAPPSNASPIWPAAGVALAALLIGGNKMIFGVLLGALVTQINTFSSSDFGNRLVEVVSIGAMACIGACLQAAWGAWMINRWVGKHDTLIDEFKIALFFILIAFSCIVSASIGIGSLFYRDLLDLDDIVWSWVVWWAGDAIGAVIFTPLLFLFFAQPQPIWKARRRYVLYPLLFSLASVIAVFKYGQHWENQRITQLFNRQVELLSKTVDTSLRNHLATNTALQAWFDSSNQLGRDDFDTFVLSIADPRNEILTWIPRVTAEQRKRWESDQQLTIRRKNSLGEMEVAERKTEYYPITFVVPAGNRSLPLGYDVGDDSASAATISQSIQSGNSMAVSGQKLATDKAHSLNTIIYSPIYHRNLPLNTEDDRRKAFSGFIANAFHIGKDIQAIYDWLGAQELQLRLEIYDSGQLIYSNITADDLRNPALSLFNRSKNIEFAGHRFQLHFVPADNFFHQQQSLATGWLLLGVLLFCGFTAFGLLVLTGRTARVEELVAARTEDLSRINRTLNQEIAIRQRQERELRIAATTFESHDAIVVTDPDGIILRVNKAFCQITGYSAEEAIGSNPRLLASGYHDKRFFRQMYEALAQNNRWQGEIWNRRKNGEIYPEWLTLTGVRDNDNRLTHYVGIFSDVTEKKAAEREIHNLAFYDPLTTLPNRRLLLERLKQEIAAAKRQRCYGALFFLDLDHFKTLNDSRGHQVGDELLIQVAQRLAAIIRDEDTACRLGGDEFIVLIPGRYSKLRQATDHAAMLAEKILAAIGQPFVVQGSELHFSTSVGVTLYPENVEQPEEVIQQADTAMYRAKESGRNSISFYRRSMQESADRRLTLEKEIRRAMSEQQFLLHYQPQVDDLGQIVSAEALIRWLHPQKGMISPAEFIPLAEDTHLILPIGDWVLNEVCRQIKAWDQQGQHINHVAVNVSSRQFRQGGFVPQVKQALAESELTADRLVIELTEGSVIENIEDTISKMQALQAMGIKISIDDFGIGYSSLSYLKSLPLSQLKIDQSFVKHINDANAAVIVETIIIMANSLGLNVIAEGVECQEHVDFLATKGCLLFQGFYFSRPVAADKFPFLASFPKPTRPQTLLT